MHETVNPATEKLTSLPDGDKLNLTAVRQAVEKSGCDWDEIKDTPAVDKDKR